MDRVFKTNIKQSKVFGGETHQNLSLSLSLYMYIYIHTSVIISLRTLAAWVVTGVLACGAGQTEALQVQGRTSLQTAADALFNALLFGVDVLWRQIQVI